jgi:hypothetical protein
MNAHAIDTDNPAFHAIRMAVHASGAGIANSADNLASAVNRQTTGDWNDPTAIRQVYPYTLFNKSPLQLRRIGARGGRAHGRNQRARRALMPTPPASVPLRATIGQNTAEAVVALDAQFPWLRAAEKRRSPNQSPSQLRPGRS